MLPRLLLTVSLPLLLAALQADAAKDLEQMQGTWTCISGEVDGKPLPDADRKKAKVIVKADKITISGVLDYPSSTAFKLNPTKAPKEIDLLPAGALKGKVSLGIYDVEEASLKICLNVYTTDNARGKERPAEFSTKGSVSRVALVLKKGK